MTGGVNIYTFRDLQSNRLTYRILESWLSSTSVDSLKPPKWPTTSRSLLPAVYIPKPIIRWSKLNVLPSRQRSVASLQLFINIFFTTLHIKCINANNKAHRWLENAAHIMHGRGNIFNKYKYQNVIDHALWCLNLCEFVHSGRWYTPRDIFIKHAREELKAISLALNYNKTRR